MFKMSKILIIHGPNLNLLGSREPEVYGTDTLEDINGRLKAQVEGAGHSFESFQSNAEHELINKVHGAKDSVSFIVINPGAYTHTSIALRDAFLGVSIPFIEIHLSNVHSREEFRQFSYLSDIAVGVITGLGASGYEMAIQAAIERI
jgi:3-dehydroquinate dehydratase-2